LSKKTILILTTLVILASASTYWLLSTQQKIGNTISVTVDQSLSIEKVTIEYGLYSINSGSDQNLVKIGLDKLVFLGKPVNSLETIAGENDFYVTYDNVHYTIVRHFIPNDFYDGIPKPHKYNFNFKRQADKIVLTVEILGPEAKTIERQLEHISNANENIWGQPKKS